MRLEETFAADQIGFPVLSVLIVLPLACALLVGFVRQERWVRRMALGGALVELALALVVAFTFVPGVSDIQFAEKTTWIDGVGIGYHVGVDGISVLFIPLTALLTVTVMVFSWNSVRFLVKPYLASVLALEAASMGVFAALDMVVFFVFWELMLVPIYLLIKLWGTGPERAFAGLKYVMYMLLGSAPLLVGIMLLGVSYHDEQGGGAAPYSFDLLTLLSTPVPGDLQTLVFFLFGFAFAVKGPLFPLHTWLPTVMLHGPIGVGILLVGLKMGLYGFVRFAIPLLPDATRDWGWLIAVLGVTAIIYGGLIALVQSDLRRLLAFASVSHVGLVALGLCSLTVQGIQGALVMMVNLGVAASGLLLLAGFIYGRTGSTDLASMGGLAKHAPLLATSFFVVGLASIGVPGTSGFPGEFLVLLGTFRSTPGLAVLAVTGVILSAALLLTYFQRAFLGPAERDNIKAFHDLRPREAGIAAAVCAVIFWIGFFPTTVLDATKGSVETLVERVDEKDTTAHVGLSDRR
jgi:NADH-quinone oxidoreductase subunit M